MKEKFSAALIIVLFLTSMSFSAIALSSESEDDGVECARAQYVDIGITSSSSDDYENTLALAELAEEDINQYCEAQGSKFRFRFHLKDNKGSGEVALTNTMEFDEMGINLIVGHGWSGQCQASLDYVNENNMLLLSPSSTFPLLAIPRDNLYRLIPSDNVQGKVIVDLYEFLNVRAVAILYRDDAWGQGLSGVIDEICQDRGIQVLANVPYNPNDWDFGTHLTDIEDVLDTSGHATDELAFQLVSFDEAVDILNEAEAGSYPTLNSIKWYGCDGTSQSQAIIDSAGDQASWVKLYSPKLGPVWDDPDFVELDTRYRAKTGQDLEIYKAVQYDCCWVYAKSVLKARSDKTCLVKLAMCWLVRDYEGVSGLCTFDVNGDRIGGNYDIWGYGLLNGIPSNIRYGYYDLETDMIIWYDARAPDFVIPEFHLGTISVIAAGLIALFIAGRRPHFILRK